MTKQIREMMTRGVEAIDLAIEHMRKPRDRMPITRVTGSKSPKDSLQSDSALDNLIFGDVSGVVIVYELAAKNRGKGGSRYNDQEKTDERKMFFFGRIHGSASKNLANNILDWHFLNIDIAHR